MVDDRKMKISRVLLSCMIVSLMMPAFADDTDGQYRGQGKRDDRSKQTAVVTTTATTATTTATTSPPALTLGHTANSFMGFKHIPVAVPNVNAQNNMQGNVQRPQPQIQNAPVGNRQNNSAQQPQVSLSNTKFETRNRWDRDDRDQYRHRDRDHDWNNGNNYNQNQTVSGGIGSDGYVRTYDPNLTSRGYIRANNSDLSSNGYIRTDLNRPINYGNSSGRYIRDRNNQGWQDRDRDRVFTQYRMPYRQGYSDRYRVHYISSWPNNYGWRSHGWVSNYRETDPYWFALITSIALAQAWSDAEVTQAINDQNLRQQLIYDEDIRQQMIASGYPPDQIYYSPNGDYDQYDYPPAGYDNPYDLNQTYPPQNTYPSQNQGGYLPPSSNPNSPLYGGKPLASGEQVANRNANQNALFFCNSGNKSQTADAFRQIQNPDLSIWKTMESYNKCRTWAIAP